MSRAAHSKHKVEVLAQSLRGRPRVGGQPRVTLEHGTGNVVGDLRLVIAKVERADNWRRRFLPTLKEELDRRAHNNRR